MDVQNPIFIALVTAVLTAVGAWVYSRYVLKEPTAEKVFAKTLVSGLLASALVILYVRQTEQVPSLHADPFFAPVA
jgi:hypothetical protein